MIHAMPSLLGERPATLPIAGKVHAGIKVLTRAAASNPEAARLYQEGVARGRGFDDIERDVRIALKLGERDRSPMVPKNTPYFRVARYDFGSAPEIADRILDLYGEVRDPKLGRQLYRFPVVLPLDQWLQVLPHGLKTYQGNNLRYWSEYDAAGQRYCMEYGGVQMDPRNQRAVRSLGGRRPMQRGLCEPSACAEYQAKSCGLKGKLLFYVPGLPGTGLIELPTTSIYSMQQMRGQMELVASMRGGRISGVHNGAPLFYLAKVAKEITMLDEQGKPKQVSQFLTHLEATLDGFDLMTQREALGAPKVQAQIAPPAPEPDPAPEDATAEAPAEAVPVVVTPCDQATGEVAPLEAALRVVRGLIRTKGVNGHAFAAEMAAKYGADWNTRMDVLASVTFDLECMP